MQYVYEWRHTLDFVINHYEDQKYVIDVVKVEMTFKRETNK